MPACDGYKRLLSGRPGILDTHVVEEGGRSVLCLHYDADTITLEDVQRWARAAGAEVTEKYGHRSWPLHAVGARRRRRAHRADAGGCSRRHRCIGQPAGADRPGRVRAREIPA